MTDTDTRVHDLLARIPLAQRQAAAALIAQYGPRLFELAAEDAWQYLRRLMAGDLEAAAELDARLTDAEWLAQVVANTARWESVAAYQRVREQVRNELLLRLAPAIVTILAALVGL